MYRRDVFKSVGALLLDMACGEGATALLLPGKDGSPRSGFLPQLEADSRGAGLNVLNDGLPEISSLTSRARNIERSLAKIHSFMYRTDQLVDVVAWSSSGGLIRQYIKLHLEGLRKAPRFRNIVFAFSGEMGSFPEPYTNGVIKEVAEVATGNVVLANSINDGLFPLSSAYTFADRIPRSKVMDMGMRGHGDQPKDAKDISAKLLPYLKR